MLVLGPRWSTLFKKEEKRFSVLDPNPVPHARTLVLGPYKEYLWHIRIVLIFGNHGFYQSILQQQNSILFAPPARPLKRWKEIYIPWFVVSIGGKEWTIDVKFNPSWVLLGLTLPSPSLRGFLKSSLSWWNPKTRWGWRLSPLFSVLNVFGVSLLWMVWGPHCTTPQYDCTSQQWSQSGYRRGPAQDVLFF